MILAVIYTAATDKDTVSGYEGSITESFRRAIGRIARRYPYCRRAGPAAYIGSQMVLLAILVRPRFFWKPFALFADPFATPFRELMVE